MDLPERPEHPDKPGVHPYLTRAQALARLGRHTDPVHAAAMLDQPDVITAPWPGQPGRLVYRGDDVDELCGLLAEWVAAGRPEVEAEDRDEV